MKRSIDMTAPLFEQMKRYAESDITRAHTPGHSGRGGLTGALSEYMKYDLTEVADLDDLYHARGVIAQAEKLCESVFKSGATLFSAGGCTLAIQTMLALALREGDTLICARNVHTSVLNTCCLLGINADFVLPDENDGFRIRPEDIDKALKARRAAAVIITSPNYYGALCDISKISKICLRHGALLLVDNAHGTHLIKFGLHPISLGADMTADSAHKTLPVLTGGAYLHIKDGVRLRDAKRAMATFGSTSPSYPVMASLDLAREYLESKESSEQFQRLKQRTYDLKKAAEAAGIRTLGGLCDPVRLTLDFGENADTALQIFRQHRIEPEMCDGRFIVLILTPFHTERDFERIAQAIRSCPSTAAETASRRYSIPERAMPIRQAYFAPSETISVEASVGRISACNVFACPPGTAIAVCGEVIDEKTVQLLKAAGERTVQAVK